VIRRSPEIIRRAKRNDLYGSANVFHANYRPLFYGRISRIRRKAAIIGGSSSFCDDFTPTSAQRSRERNRNVIVIRRNLSVAATPRGAGVPLSCLFSSFVHSLPHLLFFFTFSLFPFLVRFTYSLLSSTPSHYQKRSHCGSK